MLTWHPPHHHVHHQVLATENMSLSMFRMVLAV